jgi:hypothetical protein
MAIFALIFSSTFALVVGLVGWLAFDFSLLAAFGTYLGLSIGMTLFLVLSRLSTPNHPTAQAFVAEKA